jgi:inosose dehydratase
MRFLQERHFDGPIVVEQDIASDARETPLQLATRNFNYMQQIA